MKSKITGIFDAMKDRKNIGEKKDALLGLVEKLTARRSSTNKSEEEKGKEEQKNSTKV